jgi:spermidine/putrescine ABC transporter ATP-binding subunit
MEMALSRVRPSGIADVELRRITKRFGAEVLAIDDLSLEIPEGELVSLLGPSGCGKTTTLRVIGGYEAPDSGQILLKGVDVTDRPPNRRDLGMVFQSYALFPHMTVRANVGYGLKMRRVARAESARRVDEALELVRLSGLGDRFPREISGGQQQRVALARAIVIRPSALLLDEPLSNLDARLRQDMRREIRELQRQLALTTVFVTHDQEEALTLSDTIVVMNKGRVEQVGSPLQVYESPSSLFVTRFIGEANILAGRMEDAGPGTVRLALSDGITVIATTSGAVKVGSTAMLALRPESLRVFQPGDGRTGGYANRFDGIVVGTTYLGYTRIVHVRLDPDIHLNIMHLVEDPNATEAGASLEFRTGEPVVVAWRAEASRVIVPR